MEGRVIVAQAGVVACVYLSMWVAGSQSHSWCGGICVPEYVGSKVTVAQAGVVTRAYLSMWVAGS